MTYATQLYAKQSHHASGAGMQGGDAELTRIYR